MIPGYWRNEASGQLRPVVEKLIAGGKMDHDDICVMRAYLRQWMRGDFHGPEAEQLRRMVDEITDHESLHMWLGLAMAAGIDPL